jgi:selenocysteine lyase/cysteine desulfurase
VDFIARLVPGSGTAARRERLRASMAALQEHETALRSRLESGLSGLPGVVLHGSPTRRRTPTVLFSVDGVPPRRVHERLGARGVNAPAGTFYALECARLLGLGDAGAVRAGIAPYTDESDVDRLVDAVARLPR